MITDDHRVFIKTQRSFVLSKSILIKDFDEFDEEYTWTGLSLLWEENLNLVAGDSILGSRRFLMTHEINISMYHSPALDGKKQT